jgi:hypothetical protein
VFAVARDPEGWVGCTVAWWFCFNRQEWPVDWPGCVVCSVPRGCDEADETWLNPSARWPRVCGSLQESEIVCVCVCVCVEVRTVVGEQSRVVEVVSFSFFSFFFAIHQRWRSLRSSLPLHTRSRFSHTRSWAHHTTIGTHLLLLILLEGSERVGVATIRADGRRSERDTGNQRHALEEEGRSSS